LRIGGGEGWCSPQYGVTGELGWGRGREGRVVIVSKEGIDPSGRRGSQQVVAACTGSTGRANNLIKDAVAEIYFSILLIEEC
jgi:hypothetical protein